jgi:hypothetical protein
MWTVCSVVLLTTRLTAVPDGIAGAIRLGLSLTIIVAVLAGPARRIDPSPDRAVRTQPAPDTALSSNRTRS